MSRPRSRLIPVVVELAPGGTLADVASGGALSWVDVSRWVRLDDGIEVSRGCDSGGLAADTGTLSLVLDNSGGQFDGGEYGGALLRDMPIRVRHLGGGRDYADTAALYVDYGVWAAAEPTYWDGAGPAVLWTGAVAGARVSYAGGHVPVVRVSGVDVVQHFQRQVCRPLPVEVAVRQFGAVACWPLAGDGPLGSVVAGPSVPLSVRSFGWPAEEDGVSLAAAASPGSDGDGAEVEVPLWVGGSARNGWALDSGLLAPGAGAVGELPVGGEGVAVSPWAGGAVAHVMVWPATGSMGRVRVAACWVSTHGDVVRLGVDAVDRPFVSWRRSDLPAVTVTASSAVSSGAWHHLAVRMWSADTLGLDLELVVDGVSAVTGAHSSAVYRVGDRRVVAGAGVEPDGALVDQWVGSVANLTLGPLLDVGDLAVIAGGRHGWAGDDTVSRFGRVLGAFGYDGVTSGVGLSAMCPSAADGQALADVLAEVAVAERAPYWVDAVGRPRFAPRETYWGAPAVVSLPAGVLGAGLEFDMSDTGRRTVVRARRPGGPVVVRTSPADAEASGEVGNGSVLLLRVDSQPQVESLADEAVAEVHSAVQLRTSALAVDVVRSGALVDVGAVLEADVGSVVEVVGLPSSAPAGAGRWSVRRVTDRLSASSWVRRFDVSAAGEELAVFHVGVDLLDGPAVVGW